MISVSLFIIIFSAIVNTGTTPIFIKAVLDTPGLGVYTRNFIGILFTAAQAARDGACSDTPDKKAPHGG